MTKTRIGLTIQVAISYPRTVQTLGNNVPFVIMGLFGLGAAMAGLVGVIAGHLLGVFSGMALQLVSIVFFAIVIGGLGSILGALVASQIIGWMLIFATAYDGTSEQTL